MVDITVDEIDQKTTSVFLRIEGNEEMDYEEVEEKLEEMNCAVHSVDQIIIEKDG